MFNSIAACPTGERKREQMYKYVRILTKWRVLMHVLIPLLVFLISVNIHIGTRVHMCALRVHYVPNLRVNIAQGE